jgi:hypothetical protein
MELSFTFNGLLENQPDNYTFWYTPRNTYFIALQYGRPFFQNDLRAVIMLRTNYIGSRLVPAYREGELPTTSLLPGGQFWDAQLQLFYKDAIIFFRFDNLLRKKLDWRTLQPVRSLTFRYGINWRFWN